MKEGQEKPINQREKDDATLNFVNYQAQEAILDPNLPDEFKDAVLKFAIGTIRKVSERRNAYHARYGEERRTRRPR